METILRWGFWRLFGAAWAILTGVLLLRYPLGAAAFVALATVMWSTSVLVGAWLASAHMPMPTWAGTLLCAFPFAILTAIGLLF